MVTVHFAMGYRFVIFTNDHSPPHIHIVGNGGEAKVTLEGPTGLELEWTIGIGRGTMRKLMIEVQAEREKLIAAWGEIHG
jgi:hypothetical protein